MQISRVILYPLQIVRHYTCASGGMKAVCVLTGVLGVSLFCLFLKKRSVSHPQGVVSSRQALVYQDEGVSSSSAEALVQQLGKILDPSIIIKKVDSVYLATESWEDKTVVLAMGGGRCSLWEERLGSKGICKIHQYVMGGGKYLGFCAGAYFAASKSYFQAGDSPPISKTRSFFFFEGEARGPLWGDEDYLAPHSARAAPIHFRRGDVTLQGNLYYQGGCYFELPAPSSSVEVLGTYEGLPKALPAVILCRVGQGAAFLAGPHPEFVWNASGCWKDLAKDLTPHETFRELLWRQIGESLSI